MATKDDFCGSMPGPFWDTNLTWNQPRPSFTPCFKETVLLWIPCFVFWALLPIDLLHIRYHRPVFSSNKLLCRLQLVILIVVLTAISAVTIAKLVLWQNGDLIWFWWGFGSHLLLMATFATIGISNTWYNKVGYTGSASIWLSLFFAVICGAIEIAFAAVEEPGPGELWARTVVEALYVTYFVVLCISLLLLSFATVVIPQGSKENEQAPWPQDYCSFPNQFSFNWALSLIWRGCRYNLEIKDLWAVNYREQSEYLLSFFVKALRKEFAGVVESKKFVSSNIMADVPEITFKKRNPSIMKVLISNYGWPVLISGALEGTALMLAFVEPTVVGLVTGFATRLGSEPIWHGYVYAALLTLSLILRAFLDQNSLYRMVRVGARANSSLVGAIYRKALKLTSESRKSTTIGEIVNLMSVDAGRLFDFATGMHILWTGPLQLIVGLVLVYNQVGVAMFSGLAVVILLVAMNVFASAIYERYQEKQMDLKDDRVKLLTEVLNGIKVIKLYGWEPAFQERIEAIRKMELKYMRKCAYIGAFFEFSWHSTTLFSSIAVLSTYMLMTPNQQINVQVVFVIVSVYRILVYPLSVLPSAVAQLAQLRVTLKRLTDFFSLQEIDECQIEEEHDTNVAVRMVDASLGWEENQEPTLRDLSLIVGKKKLVAVVGKVGAGKSSLLSAICGEMHKFSGSISLQGTLAYVGQQAWIQNATIRDNILFGSAYSEKRYKKIIQACALLADFEMLPAGDQTEIGERGINLSGGQKQRVNLARAIYQNNDLYLLDDPLSAVDVHVGRHLFDEAIGHHGALKNKTRILVTHALTYLPDCDLVVVLSNGRIEEVGTFQELVRRNGAFAEFVQQYLTEAPEEELQEVQATVMDEISKIEGAAQAIRQRSHLSEGEQSQKLHRLTSIGSEKSEEEKRDEKELSTDAGKLIDEELMQIGKVSWSIYWTYARAAGFGLLLYASFVVMSETFGMLGNMWLQKWTDSVNLNDTSQHISTSTGLLNLGLCGIGQTFFTLFLGVAFAMFQIRAATLTHTKLLTSILRAPLSYFDTTPAGRIVNRCGKDINVIDNEVPGSMDQLSHFFFNYIQSLIGLFIYVPIFGVSMVPACFFYIIIQRLYVTSARRTRRLEAVMTSPIYSHFQETLQGSSTIRAFRQIDRFCDTSNQLIDTKISAQMSRSLLNRWVGIYLDLVSASVVAATCFAIVNEVVSGRMTPGVAGLALAGFAFNLPGELAWGVYVLSMLEMELVSMERIVEYVNIVPEAPWRLDHPMVPASWPSNGRIEFERLGARYRNGLPLVLRNFTVDVSAQEKVGVVGRTGAGKSSLTLALFRIVEAAEGRILIDGIDISTLGLHELRHRLTIIPQDPVLFSGTLRMNIDPFDQYTDDELWFALEHSHLKGFVSTLPDGLQHDVSEGGSNLSVGQRQLVCLARALLRKSKILILDEATAAVDVETDSWIQTTIRKQFADCTVMTIAHRLNTILDNDRIMVLEQGQLAECDTPSVLASKENSLFGTMLKEADESIAQ